MKLATIPCIANPHGQGDRTPSAASRRARCQGKGACVACIRGARPESHVAANTGRARVGGCNDHGTRVIRAANSASQRHLAAVNSPGAAIDLHLAADAPVVEDPSPAVRTLPPAAS